MTRFLKQLFYRPAIQLGSLGLKSRSPSRLRNERFASYIATNNRKVINTDVKDALLAGRRLVRQLFILGSLGLIVWVVMESAQAVGMF